MKKEVKKTGQPCCCEKICSCFKKEVSKLNNYTEMVIVLAVLSFLASILLKLILPNLGPMQINSLTAFRFSTFLILLGIALLLSRQKQKD